jgi:prepilin-type N-terminal cleavage/methylation domain-containing protein
MQINKNRKAGFTLVEIMIVVAIIGLLAAIAIPNFVRARETAQANACINNLHQIDGAIQQWAFETRAPSSAQPDLADCAPYLKGNAVPVCPASGTYNPPSTLTDAPTCTVAGHTF